MLRSLSVYRLSNILLILTCSARYNTGNEFCKKSNTLEGDEIDCGIQSHFSRNRFKYIFYDINPPEGFNLRRDVYIRVAVSVRDLVEEDKEFKWKLVLPPWGDLYHWRSRNLGIQSQIPWGRFFDIQSLQKYISVMEMYQFIEEYPSESGETQLDTVYILQNDEEMFKNGKFEDKNEVHECENLPLQYHKLDDHKYIGHFWGYGNITVRNIKCITFHGTVRNLWKNLNPSLYKTIMFDHMEIPLHDYYGSKEYWTARRSMRYNRELYEIANEFRREFLNSTDQADMTERPRDWTEEKGRRNAIGGPYLCVHLRRRDFAVGRSSRVPSIQSAASQLIKKLDELSLGVLFVATDAPDKEFQELSSYLSDYAVIKFNPSDYVLHKFQDGGIAIIEQIICSHARYFLGTHESTFTFRIQEDREIIGFPADTTFNRLCKKEGKCSSTGRWEIVW